MDRSRYYRGLATMIENVARDDYPEHYTLKKGEAKTVSVLNEAARTLRNMADELKAPRKP